VALHRHCPGGIADSGLHVQRRRPNYGAAIGVTPSIRATARRATSALDTANERQLYEQAAAAQIDVVSVGRREGLLPFHDVLLELLGDGQWRISRSGSRPS